MLKVSNNTAEFPGEDDADLPVSAALMGPSGAVKSVFASAPRSVYFQASTRRLGSD